MLATPLPLDEMLLITFYGGNSGHTFLITVNSKIYVSPIKSRSPVCY